MPRHPSNRRPESPSSLVALLVAVFLVCAACSPVADAARGPEGGATEGAEAGSGSEGVGIETFADHLDEMEAPPHGLLDPARDPHRAWEAVRTIYRNTGENPLWFVGPAPRPVAATLVAELEASRDHGLDPATYRTDRLRSRLRAAASGESSREDRRDLDVALTAAAVLYGAHLLRGRILPSQVEVLWEDREPAIVLSARVGHAIETETLSETFAALAPPYPEYRALLETLDRYRRIVESGGWPEITIDSPVEPGQEAPREVVTTLVERLVAEGFLAPGAEPPSGSSSETPRYSNGLAAVVERFQASRTLAVDGVLGPETVAALNRPPDEVVTAIRMSLDRWRWMPHDLGSLAVVVNIPTYDLLIVQDGVAVDRMGVVVGKAGWPTAIIRDEIERVVFHPYWNVPRSIQAREIVPKLRENPSYLEEEGLQVVRGWGNGEVVPREEVSPIDLADPESDLRLRQPPGPANALGRVKFVFPNRANIYLHDTPAGHLFEEPDRGFSHGCVRVERPADLAVKVLGGRNGWTREKVEAAIDRGENRHVTLDERVPVYITYMTAIPASGGGIVLGEDIYDLDDRHRALWNRSSEGR